MTDATTPTPQPLTTLDVAAIRAHIERMGQEVYTPEQRQSDAAMLTNMLKRLGYT